jgi:hemoglobin
MFKTVLTLLVVSLCVSTGSARAAETGDFEAFGGKEGLRLIARELIVLSVADPRTKEKFADFDSERLEGLLTEQFCQLVGGPCKYSGKSMKESHANMGVTPAHFNALAENLQIAMDKKGVPFRAQNRLLAKLAPMSRDIITK